MDKKRKNIPAIIAVLIILAVGGYFLYNYLYPAVDEESCELGSSCSVSSFEPTEGLEVGNIIPNIDLQTMDGETIKLYDAIGDNERFVLNFSTDWCPDCHREKQKLQAAYDSFENLDVAVVYINRESTLEQAKEYVEKENWTFPVYYDVNSTLQNQFGVYRVPYNIMIKKDKEGNFIIKSKSEEIDMDNLMRENEAFVEESE